MHCSLSYLASEYYSSKVVMLTQQRSSSSRSTGINVFSDVINFYMHKNKQKTLHFRVFFQSNIIKFISMTDIFSH